MKPSVYITIIFLLTIVNLYSQNYQWAKNIGGISNDLGNGIAVDNLGNVYVTGYFMDIVDFDPGSGQVNLTSNGNSDIFFAKYNSNGNLIWAKSIGSTSGDIGFGITVDLNQNVFLTGRFSGSADFDPGTGNAVLTSNGLADIFIAKYDFNGNYLWAKSIGGTGTDIGNKITVDNNGNVYITGYFESTVDFDPGAGTLMLTSIGAADIYFGKFSNNGNLIWAKAIGSNSTTNDIGKDIKVDSLGNIYITGNFSGIIDFDPGSGTSNYTSIGNADIFLAKYDNNGNYLWSFNIGSLGNSNSGTSITIDNIGNLYLTGYFKDNADFNPGTNISSLISNGNFDMFFAKYDNNGNYIFAKNIGGAGSEDGVGIEVDESGCIYILGNFTGDVDFDPGVGIVNIVPFGFRDFYLAKYDNVGNFIWASGFGSSNDDRSYCLTLDANSIYITGLFYSTIDFDPGIGIANLTSIGNTDVFFAKYSQITGVSETISSAENDVLIYVNQLTKNISLYYKNIQNKMQISIYNIEGKLIFNKVFNNQSNININGNSFTKGIYFIKSETENKVDTKKIVIQ